MSKSPVKWLTDQEYAQATNREKAVAWADSFDGQKEVGQNAGPFVAEVLKSVGLKTGHAWCASFVSYVFSKAQIKTGPKLHRYRVRAWVDWGHEKGRLYYSHPKRGDLCARLNRNGTGHIGFVLSEPDFDGTYRTIEGNTNAQGSREGHGVFKRTRNLAEGFVFVRWWD